MRLCEPSHSLPRMNQNVPPTGNETKSVAPSFCQPGHKSGLAGPSALPTMEPRKNANRMATAISQASIFQPAWNEPPLCVDLDGTLVRTDTLHESLVRVIARQWWVLFLLPLWLFRGRASLKEQLSARVTLDASRLPYRQDLLDWLTDEHERDRYLVLATGANSSVARAVGEHLGIFDEVIASSSELNVTGSVKARLLCERFGANGFDYVGDSAPDRKVWRQARQRIAAGPAAKPAEFDRTFAEKTPRAKALLRALRPKHWVKNILVFVPLMASHRLLAPGMLVRNVLTFIALSLIASAVYVVNDLLDLDSDRIHPVKCRRPFASGDLSLRFGLLAVPLLFAAGFALAAPLGRGVLAILGFYFVLTSAYSLYLKRKLLVDVFTLAILYTVRIVAGAEATHAACSVWLLGFSVFQFLSLAFLKRSAELSRLLRQARSDSTGRGYFSWDLAQVNIFGISAGYVSCLVLGMYIGGDQGKLLYREPSWLWLIVLMQLYWMTRVWILAHRGAMDEDPILFAAGDRVTWICAATALSVLAIATVGGIALPGIAQ